jgi:hypothetical protein
MFSYSQKEKELDTVRDVLIQRMRHYFTLSPADSLEKHVPLRASYLPSFRAR